MWGLAPAPIAATVFEFEFFDYQLIDWITIIVDTFCPFGEKTCTVYSMGDSTFAFL